MCSRPQFPRILAGFEKHAEYSTLECQRKEECIQMPGKWMARSPIPESLATFDLSITTVELCDFFEITPYERVNFIKKQRERPFSNPIAIYGAQNVERYNI